MALDKNKLTVFNQGNGPWLNTYETADNAATVQGAGYFNGIADIIRNNSFLMAIMGDATKIYKVTKSGSTVTLSTGQAIA